MGWRQTGCFPPQTRGLCLITAAKPPYGVDGAVFGAPWLLHGVSLYRAEVVMAVSRPGGLVIEHWIAVAPWVGRVARRGV